MSYLPTKERRRAEDAIRILREAYNALPNYALNVDPRKQASLDKIIARLEAWIR